MQRDNSQKVTENRRELKRRKTRAAVEGWGVALLALLGLIGLVYASLEYGVW